VIIMENTNCIIDRFEGEKPQWAVIEYNGEITFNIPRNLLPTGAQEGDVIEFKLQINKAETNSRRDAAQELLRELLGGE
jgi:hypothetical protein